MIKPIAIIVALFAISTPARAATIQIENLDLNFANGYQEIGTLGLTSFKSVTLTEVPSLYFNGILLDQGVAIPIGPDNFGSFPQYDPIHNVLVTFSYPFYFPNSVLGEYAINDINPVSGTITLVEYQNLPLPGALPLFGSSLLLLVGFAAYRMKRLSDVTR